MGGNWSAIGTPQFWLSMLVIVLSIGLHEYGHAKFADLSGDPTPRMMGRVTLNPLKHLDPLGFICIVVSSLSGFGLGWGKPVMVRTDLMRNPRWDDLVTSAAGPAMNLLLSFVFALAYRLTGANTETLFGQFLYIGVVSNVSLMLFNLIPIGPLDGHWILGAFLPDRQRAAWFQFNRGIGTIIFLALVLIPWGRYDPIAIVIGPPLIRMARFLLGY